ncbi:MAG: squalene/phytoene synthase family protein [Anaerolineales bacterium]
MDLTQVLRETSRTFSIGIERLPGKLGNAMTIAYLLLRVSDYFEDNLKMTSGQKVELLRLWEQVLAGEIELHELTQQLPFLDELNPDAIAVEHIGQIIDALRRLPENVRRPIIKHVRDSTQGMARWVARGPRVQNEADMDDYMHEVAGRVGYLVTELFAWYSFYIRLHLDKLIPLARECGLALQTVNIIRGLHDDYERGWIFVPESYCEAVGIPREALFDPEHHEQAMQVVDMLANKAERHLQAAKMYFKALPPWQHAIRLSCLYPLLFAVRTLAISNDHRVLKSEAKITRDEVKEIVRNSTLFGWSNWWVDYYYQQLNVVRVEGRG